MKKKRGRSWKIRMKRRKKNSSSRTSRRRRKKRRRRKTTRRRRRRRRSLCTSDSMKEVSCVSVWSNGKRCPTVESSVYLCVSLASPRLASPSCVRWSLKARVGVSILYVK